MNKQIFMDTAFLLAVIDNSDKYHKIAKESYKKIILGKWTIITTEGVLIEIGNGLSKIKWRDIAYQWITRIQRSNSIFNIVPVTIERLNKAIFLYGSRLDKEWGITDCISFVVMKEYDLKQSLTLDHHFEQAGYKILMKIDS